MAGSYSRGRMNYQVSHVGSRRKKTTSRCATGRGDTTGESAGLFQAARRSNFGKFWQILALKVPIERRIS